MQKVLPVILMVFALTVIALFSDMVGVTVRQMRRSAAPVDLEGVPATTEVYNPAWLDGSIPPH